jgi:predicted amidohydrolase
MINEKLVVSCVQINAGDDFAANKVTIIELLKKYDLSKTELLAFPECSLFRGDVIYKEAMTGESVSWFQNLAKEYACFVLVGSFFEETLGEKAYNCSVLINAAGEIVQSYRKINLFDVSVDKREICESKKILAGNSLATADIKGFKAGFSICYDLRFPELFRNYVQQGCTLFFVPSSFTKSTGKLHWHTLLRARAIENQCYVIAPNQFGIGTNQVDTFGHSLIIDPLGQIIAEASADKAEIITAVLDLKKLGDMRKRFPVLRGIV